MVQGLRRTGWQILNELKMESHQEPAIPLLEIHPKELKAGLRSSICPLLFIAALFAIAKMWKPPVSIYK